MRRSEKLVCWVEPDLRRAIEAAADADERSVSDWLRLAAKRVAANTNASATADRLRGMTDATRKIIKSYTG